ncbi:MAG: preprotein translocase subunit SecE [SAR202 cluster bacterium]|nr:preprotein translocase subunit SecE [SAR202 cluster bacterium]
MARSEGVPRRLEPNQNRRAFSLRFFGEVFNELKRVTWPTREETFRLSIMVIIISAIIGVFLGLIDIGFSKLIDVIIQ